MSYLPQPANYLDWIIQAHEAQAQYGTDTFVLAGQEFVAYPYVFNPNIATSSKLFAEYILQLDLTGKRVVDAGCGSGILTVAALLAGAEYVYSFDVNPKAVANTRENLARLPRGLDNCEVYCANQLPKDQGLFDYLVCNPPFFRSEAAQLWQYAITDSDNSLVKHLMESSRRTLLNECRLILTIGGNINRTAIINQLMQYQFNWTQLSREGLQIWLLEILHLSIRSNRKVICQQE